MKQRFSSICCNLLVLLMVGLLAITLTNLYCHMSMMVEEEQQEISPVLTPGVANPIFNNTLLEFAAVEISEPRLKREINDLMEGNFTGLSSIKARFPMERTINGLSGLEHFYKLWVEFREYLGNWSKNRVSHPEILSEFSNHIKVLLDNHHGCGSKQKYKTCAVVGNSGTLLNQNYGKLIDSHETVIRLNNARIRGFEHRVGSKTTISFMNSNIFHRSASRLPCFCHPYGENIPIVMYICQPIQIFDYLFCNSSIKSPLLVTDPRFDTLCGRISKYYSAKRFVKLTGKDLSEWAATHDGENFHYSSGMQAAMLAVGMCEKVSMFGFGKSESAKHHYHTNQKTELSVHDYEGEYEFYKDLIQNPQLIPFISERFKFPPVVMYH